ncbi:MAG: uroporphyrinogen-III synthase [Alphaproteobacteria bacterium]|nr:uroporphyrinogen-III synthase [Alphaproteobacteria bacterium]
MSKKIVITRANHQAQAFAAAIVNQMSGVSMNDFVFEPMSEIVHFPFDPSRFEEYDGIIMTSMNAAVSLGLNAPARDLLADKPFYCVGEHTKQKILSVGAQNVAICQSTADQLAKEMLKGNNPGLDEGKKLLYLRGRNIAFDMKEALLERKGWESSEGCVDEVMCYEARDIERFSPNATEMFLPGEIGLVTFFSKRTAEVFAHLWNEEADKKSDCKDSIKGVKALCISHDVAEVVHEIFGKSVCVVAKTPSVVSMIDRLEEVLI